MNSSNKLIFNIKIFFSIVIQQYIYNDLLNINIKYTLHIYIHGMALKENKTSH